MSSVITDIKENPTLKAKRQLLPSKDDSFIGNYASSLVSDNNFGYTQKVIKTGEELLKQKWIEKLLKEPVQENENTGTFNGDININIKALNGLIQQKIEDQYKDQLEKDRQKLDAYEKKQKEKILLNSLEDTIKTNNLNPIRVDIAPKLIDINGNEIGLPRKELNIPGVNGQSTIQKYTTQDMSNEISKFNPNGNLQDNIIQNSILSSGDEEAIDSMKKIKKYKIQRQMSGYDLQMEIVKCRLSALYFIENYVSVPVAGGRISMRESEQWNMTDKYKIIINLFQQHDSVLYMSSRQSGKTTTSAMYLLWCMIFFPKIQISYLTLDKNRALDMISRMKEMMDSLPKWMQVKPSSKAERLSYYELSNGSKISASFVSGSNDPDRVGRGLSSPIIFMDEAAFIPHAEVVWGAVQPSVSAAKKFAKQFGYPFGVIMTSTPNGAGDNFFYNVYQNSVKFDDIYDYSTKALYPDYNRQFQIKEKNAFISVVLHWSEFRTEEWYEQQKKELNFNIKKINQELDLSFLGSTTCIFSDNVIAQLHPKKRISKIKLAFGNEFDLFGEIDPNETYILGVDTAMSAGEQSDYSSMVLTRAKDGQPIGEWHGRFSVVKRFSQLVKIMIQALNLIHGLNPKTLIVGVERNSIGKAVVEELLYDDSTFDYTEYLFGEYIKDEKVYGIYTSNSGTTLNPGKRDKMFQMLMSFVNENPFKIHGRLLINELRNLEQKQNGRIEASKNQHDDVVMSWNFCLYVRDQLIKRGELFVSGELRTRKNISSDVVANVLGVSTPGSTATFQKLMKKYGYVSPEEEEAKNKKINQPETIDLKELMENVFVKEVPDESYQTKGQKLSSIKTKNIPSPEVFNPGNYFIMI